MQDETSVRAIADPASGERGLEIIWSHEHRSFFPWARILKTINPAWDYLNNQLARQIWNSAAQLAKTPYLKIAFAELISLEGQPDHKLLLDMLEQLQKHGIVIIEGVPTEATGDQTCMLRKVMSHIGTLRNTFYGETWDVKAVEQSKNVAYTNINLGLHMDLL